MKRCLTMLSVVGLLLCLLASDASACGRCGLFGRLCRFNNQSHHHHVAVVADAGYAAPAGNQTFIFNNSAVGNLPLAAQGASVYGYSLAAQAYSVDPAAVLSQAARLTSNAQALASDGLAGFNVTAQAQLAGQSEVAKILAQGQSATAALLAAKGADTPAAVQSFSFRATVENGDVRVERLDSSTVGALSLAADASLAAVVTARCAFCHSGAAPKGGLDLTRIDGADAASMQTIIDRLTTGDPAKLMPKGDKRLSSVELGAFFRRYEQLRGAK